MAKTEYASMKIPRPIYDRLVAMQKMLSSQAQGRSPAVVTVSLGAVVEAALDALKEKTDE